MGEGEGQSLRISWKIGLKCIIFKFPPQILITDGNFWLKSM